MIILETMLFISALTKDYYGREYLMEENLMKKMMVIRKTSSQNEKLNGVMHIIFQMLSTKKSCQAFMIDNGLIEEIVE